MLCFLHPYDLWVLTRAMISCHTHNRPTHFEDNYTGYKQAVRDKAMNARVNYKSPCLLPYYIICINYIKFKSSSTRMFIISRLINIYQIIFPPSIWLSDYDLDWAPLVSPNITYTIQFITSWDIHKNTHTIFSVINLY